MHEGDNPTKNVHFNHRSLRRKEVCECLDVLTGLLFEDEHVCGKVNSEDDNFKDLIIDEPATNDDDDEDVLKNDNDSDDSSANGKHTSSLSLLSSSTKKRKINFTNSYNEEHMRFPIKTHEEDSRCNEIVKKMEKHLIATIFHGATIPWLEN